jgi:hypothetical protein
VPARLLALLAITAVVALASCGGDGDDGGDKGSSGETKTQASSGPAGAPVADKGGRQAAAAFRACFQLDGYKAQVPRTPIGIAPSAAKANGYDVSQVFLNADKGALYTTTVSFFDSEAKKDEAKRKLKLDFGSADVPDADERGAAVVEYTAKQARPATRDAVLSCLG